MINAYWPIYKISDMLAFKENLIFSTDFGEILRY